MIEFIYKMIIMLEEDEKVIKSAVNFSYCRIFFIVVLA